MYPQPGLLLTGCWLYLDKIQEPSLFLPRFNSVIYIRKLTLLCGHSLHVDVSLTDLEGIWNNEIYAARIFNIYQMDLIIGPVRLWTESWSYSAVKFYCNNSAVVQVVQTGKTRDDMLALCLRNIWLTTATYDITLTIGHIEGKYSNIADALYRIYSDKPVNQHLLKNIQKSHIWWKIPLQFFNLNISILFQRSLLLLLQ